MNNKLKIAVGASIILMGIALLITQSINMAAYAQLDVQSGTEHDKAAVGVAFVTVGLVVALGAAYYSFKNSGEINKTVLLALAVSFVFIFIGAAVPMDDQRKEGDIFSALTDAEKAFGREHNSTVFAAAQMFPAALTFLLAGSAVFLGSTAYGINKHEFDL